MKTKISSWLVAAALTFLPGCMSVPATHVVLDHGQAGKFELSSPKDVVGSNIVVKVDMDGKLSTTIGSISSKNSPEVIAEIAKANAEMAKTISEMLKTLSAMKP